MPDHNSHKIHRNQAQNQSELLQFARDHHDTIVMMFQALFSDFVNLNPSYRDVDSARDLACIVSRLSHEGLGFLSTTLPNLMSSTFELIETGKASFAGFKLHPRTGLPVFLGRLFGEVVNDGLYSEVSFGQIYQVCSLFKKLIGPFKESVLRDNLRKFIEEDEEIGRLDFTAEPLQPILDDARQLIETIFKDVELHPGTLLPKPGPGATNTPVDKWHRFRPHVIYTQLDEEFDYLQTFYGHSWDPHLDAWRYMHLPEKDDAESRFKYVPKYLGKPRGICIEENEMQFFQQGLKRFLYTHLESHPATRGRINFSSQSVNRNLALNASTSRAYATIDMSSASDRVARELVFRLTWNTRLLHLLDAVSTRRIKLPDGSTLYSHKFAPMGSGVCFPVMALVHWALIRSIIKLSSLTDSKSLAKRTYVYGDDIIIPTEAYEAVITYLPLFGMKLNNDKSFHRSPFRESCGIHAYNGVDVTPVYINRLTSNNQANSDSSKLLSLIAKEAQFFNKGYYETSRCIQSLVHKHYWLLPTVGSDSPILGWRRGTVTHAESVIPYARKSKYNTDLQRHEYNLQTIVPQWEDDVSSVLMTEGDAYLRKLLTFADEAHTMPGNVDQLCVRRRWVAIN